MARTTSRNSDAENSLRVKQCETVSTFACRDPEFCLLVAYETRYVSRHYLIRTGVTRTKNNSDNSRPFLRSKYKAPKRKKNMHFTVSSHKGEQVKHRKCLPNTYIWQLTFELVQFQDGIPTTLGWASFGFEQSPIQRTGMALCFC